MACILQPVACLFGYWVARWAGMTMKDQRTISLETGVQSFTLTIAVINLTFEDTVLKKALMFPLAYGILYFANSAGLVAFYRYYLAPLDGPEEEEDKDEKKEPSGAAAEEGAVEEGGKVPTEEPSTEVELANNA